MTQDSLYSAERATEYLAVMVYCHGPDSYMPPVFLILQYPSLCSEFPVQKECVQFTKI